MSNVQDVNRMPAPQATDVLKPSRRRRLLLAAGAVLSAAALISLIVWIAWPSPKPLPLNADTTSLAVFVSSEQYLRMPFELQERYMRVLEDREDNGELKRAFVAGRLTESQYRAAIQEAWLGEQFKRARKYAALPPGPERVAFINDLLDRKRQNKNSDAIEEEGGESGSGKSEARENADFIKRDPSASQMRIDSWPPAVRDQLMTYRKDYESQKQTREKSAAAAATRPASP